MASSTGAAGRWKGREKVLQHPKKRFQEQTGYSSSGGRCSNYWSAVIDSNKNPRNSTKFSSSGFVRQTPLD